MLPPCVLMGGSPLVFHSPSRARLRNLAGMSLHRSLQAGWAGFVVVVFVGCVGPADPPPARRIDGWKPLFNGRSLEGWAQRGGQAMYRVEQGEIVGVGVPNTPNSFLCTARDYTNFILELEFKVAAGFNSGVQIRSHAYDQLTDVRWKGEVIKVPAGRVHGLQVEIDPTVRAWSGGLYEEGRRKWFNTLSNNVPAQKAFKAGAWNKFHIEAIGDSYQTALNGVPADRLKDSLDASGFIALQVHSIGQRTNDLEVRFRNLRIKELP